MPDLILSQGCTRICKTLFLRLNNQIYAEVNRDLSIFYFLITDPVRKKTVKYKDSFYNHVLEAQKLFKMKADIKTERWAKYTAFLFFMLKLE
jgi:hypothetical protein